MSITDTASCSLTLLRDVLDEATSTRRSTLRAAPSRRLSRTSCSAFAHAQCCDLIRDPFRCTGLTSRPKAPRPITTQGQRDGLAEPGRAPERRIGAELEWKVTWPPPGDACRSPSSITWAFSRQHREFFLRTATSFGTRSLRTSHPPVARSNLVWAQRSPQHRQRGRGADTFASLMTRSKPGLRSLVLTGRQPRFRDPFRQCARQNAPATPPIESLKVPGQSDLA